MRPAIIIPAFNPPVTFPLLMKSIRNLTSIPIIVVDDGSQPDVQIESEITYVKLLKNNINHGKGYSLIKGFHYANDQGYTHAITLDADSQHDPDLIPKFLSIDADISIVCGKRDLKGSMPFHRRLSNFITSIIVSCICHTKLFDSQCGYRRYHIKEICMGTFYEKGYQFETEVMIKLLRDGLKISHIDIPTIYSNERSSMRHFHDTIKFIRMIVRTLRKL